VEEALRGVAEARSALDSGEASSVELVEAALTRAQAHASLCAVVGVRPGKARDEAQASDERRAKGELRSTLDGLPVLLKDNMVVEGEPTTCASRILEGFVSPYDATVVERLRAGGAVILGRTNMDEFAMGSSTESSIFGAARNPWDASRTCGGSSGGSAAAVAAGIVPVTLGSDTGGSIRQPAGFCGVTAIKPTYGRVSRWGLVAYASSLDQIGPLTRSAADAAAVLDVIAGHDPRDSTSLPEPVPRFAEALDGGVEGLRIGLPRECFVAEGVDPGVLASVRAAVDELESAGATLVEVSLPHAQHGIAAYYLIATAEASSNLARFDGVRYGHRAAGALDIDDLYRRSRSEGFGAEVKRRILLGTYVLSAGYYDAYYRRAQQVRTLLRRDFEAAFQQCDVLVTPTSPELPFALGDKGDDPVTMYLSDVYTVTANLAGVPAMSIPCAAVGGLPVGLQLLGRQLEEATLLRVADAFQRRTDHHLQRPPEPA
jgi:aspartyl-tRNA(Asn)/glutamyl-tRNA(Gln) amidotransferase subunit A